MEEMTIHLDYGVSKNCKNPESYGEICVKCNKCHRFNPHWRCINCGKRTMSMKSRQTWEAVELYDVFRAPICPDCQQYFTNAEKGIGTVNAYPAVIREHLKDFKKRRKLEETVE